MGDCKLAISREIFMIMTFCQMHKMFISDDVLEQNFSKVTSSLLK